MVFPHRHNGSGQLLGRKRLVQVLLSWLLSEIYIYPRSAHGWCQYYLTLDRFWPQTSSFNERFVYSSVLQLRGKKRQKTSQMYLLKDTQVNVSFLPFVSLLLGSE